MKVSSLLHAPAALRPRKEPRYSLDRRMGEPRSRSGSGDVEKNPALQFEIHNWVIMRYLHNVHKTNAYRAGHVCLSIRPSACLSVHIIQHIYYTFPVLLVRRFQSKFFDQQCTKIISMLLLQMKLMFAKFWELFLLMNHSVQQ
jgi:hypothetical protein